MQINQTHNYAISLRRVLSEQIVNLSVSDCQALTETQAINHVHNLISKLESEILAITMRNIPLSAEFNLGRCWIVQCIILKGSVSCILRFTDFFLVLIYEKASIQNP